MREALATLTRLPVAGEARSAGVEAFAIAGAVVGLGGLVPLALLGDQLPVIAAVLAVASMAILSGGLHLDGLADTADALLAPDPATAERARRDPAIGVGGIVALLLVLAVEVLSLAGLADVVGPLQAGIACLVAGACSRVLPVALVLAVRPRVRTGLAGWFAATVTVPRAGMAIATAVAIVLGAAFIDRSPVVPVGAMAGSTVAFGLGLWIVRARRQLDGDGLGATVELGFAAIVVATAVVAGRPGI